MPCSPHMFFVALIVATVLIAGCCTSPSPEGVAVSGPAEPTENTRPDLQILASVPDLLQNASYTCGATALRAVLLYWGKDIPEDILVRMLNTTDESGTPPQNIVNVSRTLGYTAEIRTSLTLTDIETLVRAGVPVIVGLGEERNESTGPFADTGWKYGHYMVVIGFDEKNVCLEDPSRIGRAVIPRREFLTRWQEFIADIRNPDAVSFTRMAIIIRGDAPGSTRIIIGR